MQDNEDLWTDWEAGGVSDRLPSRNLNARELAHQGSCIPTCIRKRGSGQSKFQNTLNCYSPGIRKSPQAQLPLQNHRTKSQTLVHLKNKPHTKCVPTVY